MPTWPLPRHRRSEVITLRLGSIRPSAAWTASSHSHISFVERQVPATCDFAGPLVARPLKHRGGVALPRLRAEPRAANKPRPDRAWARPPDPPGARGSPAGSPTLFSRSWSGGFRARIEGVPWRTIWPLGRACPGGARPAQRPARSLAVHHHPKSHHQRPLAPARVDQA